MKNIGKEDRWLITSCFQKSLRRGFEDLALHYGKKLYELDQNYIIHKISNILLEDIGIANLDLVQEFLAIENNPEELKNRGSINYLNTIIIKICRSNKDRTIADLTELAKVSNNNEITPNNLEEIFLNDNNSLIKRLKAGWKILEDYKFKNSVLIKNADIEKFLELHHFVIHDIRIIEILKNSYITNNEHSFIALSLISDIYNREKDFTIGKFKTGDIITNQYTSQLVGSKWLIEGIDWHTKEGKAAISEFSQEKTKTRDALKNLGVSLEYLPAAIGMLLFRLHGHQVNKRLVYPSSVYIMKLARSNSFHSLLKNELADFKNMLIIFEDEYPILKSKVENIFKKPDPMLFPF